jgi:hypothetical protein
MVPRIAIVIAVLIAEFARRVHCPTLMIQGVSDLNVPLRSYGNSDVSVRIFPGVSHSLLPDPTASPADG